MSRTAATRPDGVGGSWVGRVAAGEEVVITRGGEPVARLVPVRPAAARTLGEDRGAYVVPDDFDAPLPEELVRAFEGRE